MALLGVPVVPVGMVVVVGSGLAVEVAGVQRRSFTAVRTYPTMGSIPSLCSTAAKTSRPCKAPASHSSGLVYRLVYRAQG